MIMYIEEKYMKRACLSACPNWFDEGTGLSSAMCKKLEPVRYEKAREVLRDGSVRENEFAIPVEHSIMVHVNGREVMEISCTGQYLAELVLGRLLPNPQRAVFPFHLYCWMISLMHLLNSSASG